MNPYIAGIAGSVKAEILHEKCARTVVVVKGLPRAITAMLKTYWNRMLEDSGIEMCSTVRVELARRLPPSGLYSGLTAYLVHSIVGHDSGVDLIETLEVARHADGSSKDWPGVLDALRLASLSKGPVVYRSDDEYMKLPAKALDGLSHEYTRRAEAPLVTRESVGSEVYSGLIHLMGVSVVEAARRILDTGDFWLPVARFLSIHAGMAEAVWGISYKRNCIPSPGIPRRFEVLCRDV